MAPSAKSSLRRIFEQRLSEVSLELENLLAESCERAERQLADWLNQAVRRMRDAGNAGAVGATLLGSTTPFCAGAALFRIEGKVARAENIRGVPADAAERFRTVEIPFAAAPAMAGAIESRDPVVAAAAPSEISPQLCDLIGHPPDTRVSIFPLLVRKRVTALLYAWGSAPGAPAAAEPAAALELLSQAAAWAWSALPEVPAGLVAIAAAPQQQDAGSVWDRLGPAEQEMHLRAQRFARVEVAEMRLFEAEAVQAGRARRDLYGTLGGRIDAAREKFRQAFFAACPSMVDYLHLELVRNLAHDDAELLGKTYPGPMV